MPEFTVYADARHWFDVGLSDVDAIHWIPVMSSEELGLAHAKLAFDIDTDKED